MRIIAGRWRGHTIRPPKGRDTRPTTDRVREAWMSAMQPELPDARVLDLYAGSGALGLEALSRGAAHATFVERAHAALAALRQNVERLGAADQADVVRDDALRFAAKLAVGAYDVAVADPPYGGDDATRLVRLFERTPFARTLWIEHRKSDPLPELYGARSRRYGDTVITRIPADHD